MTKELKEKGTHRQINISAEIHRKAKTVAAESGISLLILTETAITDLIKNTERLNSLKRY